MTPYLYDARGQLATSGAPLEPCRVQHLVRQQPSVAQLLLESTGASCVEPSRVPPRSTGMLRPARPCLRIAPVSLRRPFGDGEALSAKQRIAVEDWGEANS